jgi:hypothetical protein
VIPLNALDDEASARPVTSSVADRMELPSLGAQPKLPFVAEEPWAPPAEPRAPPPFDGLPIIPPTPPDEERPSAPAVAPWPDVVEPVSRGAQPGVQILAEEPSAPPVESRAKVKAPPAGDELAIVPLKPLDEERRAPPTVPAPAQPSAPWAEPMGKTPPRNDELPVIPLKPLDDERPAPPGVQILADEPPAESRGKTGPRDERAPIIRLRPLGDEAPLRAGRPFGDAGDGREEIVAATPQHARPGGTLLRLACALGDVLSRCLDPINRLERGLPLFTPEGTVPRRTVPSARREPQEPRPASIAAPAEVRVLAEEPMGPRGGDGGRRPTPDDGLPVIPPKPLESDEAPWAATARRRLFEWTSGWVRRLKARVGRLPRKDRPQDRPRPSVPLVEPAPSRAVGLVPREPLTPPPPVSELPVLRFADADEPRNAEDVYEPAEGESLLHVAWLWTRRVVVAAALVAGGVLATLTWGSWSPQALRLGRMALTGIDDYARSRVQAEEQRRALEKATEQLPHLSPETIRRVLSSSLGAALDPPEVFQLACEAADRGVSALTPGEAEELRTLRRELLRILTPGERELVREYDAARAHRVVFAFESRAVLGPYARGARALSSESRERLQALLGKAIAAGLRVPTRLAPADTQQR